jgi:hypothetical protein
MLMAIAAIVTSQLVLAALLFGTDSLDRGEAPRWLRTHPLAGRFRSTGPSVASLQRRRDELERLGAAAHRAAQQTV